MKNKFNSHDLDVQGKDYKKEKSVNQSAYIYGYRYKTIRSRIEGPKILEVGIGSGAITTWLSNNANFDITSVDGSRVVLDNAVKKVENEGRLDRVTFVYSYFESFKSHTLFDDILMTNILEHVDDPVKVISHMKQFLSPGGRIHITVPNAMSFHRILGKEMGMLDSEDSLNAHDIQVGHQRVYTADLLEEHSVVSGLRVVDREGIIFKSLSNSQINDIIDIYGKSFTDGLYAMGKQFPEYATEIYICCQV